MLTRWGHALERDLEQEREKAEVIPEYPRPLLVRDSWTNLNGVWQYAITPLTAPQPAQWDGDIVVPFCAESILSGVHRSVTPADRL